MTEDLSGTLVLSVLLSLIGMLIMACINPFYAPAVPWIIALLLVRKFPPGPDIGKRESETIEYAALFLVCLGWIAALLRVLI